MAIAPPFGFNRICAAKCSGTDKHSLGRLIGAETGHVRVTLCQEV